MGMKENRKPLILKGRNGGRKGTRTPDLLRVKQVVDVTAPARTRRFGREFRILAPACGNESLT